MDRLNTIFLFVLAGMMICCKTRKTSKSLFRVPYLVAWNEDTVLTRQISFQSSGRFLYTISHKDSSRKEVNIFYDGTYNNTNDTIFLSFNKASRSHNIKNYLVKEMSGGYLIQYFNDNRERVFLRIVPTRL